MKRWSRWLGLGIAAGIAVALVPVMQGSVDLQEPLRRLSGNTSSRKVDLEGLDLMRLQSRPRGVMAPLRGGRTAELTLDPEVQRVAQAVMRRYRVPEAGTVMLDARTGEVLVWASHVQEGAQFDVNLKADAPAASLFKVITGAALVERSGLNSESEQCYHGGKSRISAAELVDDAVKDQACATLGIAMGRSLNVVFARLAKKNLAPGELAEMAGAFGFGRSVPFVVENDPPRIDVPADPIEYARMAAGFFHTTLSPLAAASMAQTVANGGVTLQPRIVRSIWSGNDKLWQDPGKAVVVRRAVQKQTADQLRKMMLQTVENGSAYKSFHDNGKPYLPKIRVAGKTGTLTDYKTNRHYTWFIGFAPADAPEVAISTLVVNNPNWRIKGPQLAAAVLRAYFANKGREGVSAP